MNFTFLDVAIAPEPVPDTSALTIGAVLFTAAIIATVIYIAVRVVKNTKQSRMNMLKGLEKQSKGAAANEENKSDV